MALEDIAKGQYENLLQINIDELNTIYPEGLVQVVGSVTGFGRSMIITG